MDGVGEWHPSQDPMHRMLLISSTGDGVIDITCKTPSTNLNPQ